VGVTKIRSEIKFNKKLCTTCFSGLAEDDPHGISHIQISSGSRTYRIPSPTRPHAKNPFLQHQTPPQRNVEPEVEKGFYISFDDAAPPKRPKPPLRAKRGSPKKVFLLYFFSRVSLKIVLIWHAFSLF